MIAAFASLGGSRLASIPFRLGLRVAGSGCLVLALLAGAGCRREEGAAPGQAAITPQQIVALFEQLDAAEARRPATAIDPAKVPRTDPDWPTVAYLAGEVHLKRREFERARNAFRELASWGVAAAGTPAQSAAPGWGGSGLATVALWRWLQLLDEHGGPPDEIGRAIAVGEDLQRTRLFAGMVRSGLLPALPLLEEDVARRLAHIAAKPVPPETTGRPEATGLFLDFINIDSSGELDASEQQFVQSMIGEGIVTAQRLDLFRYRRQLSLVKTYDRKQRAAEELRRLWEDGSAPADVRAEAGYEWGNFYRQSKARKPDVLAALNSAYELMSGKGLVAERALYRRAMVQGSVEPKDNERFFADMQRLLERHPRSRLADDALYQVGAEQLFGTPAQPDRAFATFARLRTYPGANDFQDSAYFLPALGRFDRGTDADLEAADRLLAEYVERYPDGVFRQRCLFWRGRIAERRGKDAAARDLFRQVVDEAPYDYHGLRARMHLELGAAAIGKALPAAGSATSAELRSAYRDSGAQGELAGRSPYHARLRAAQASGLYVHAREIVDGLGRRFHNRLDNIALEKLDSNGLVPVTALLLSWRQDALAARDTQRSADNQLRLAAYLELQVGDWPTAMMVAALPAGAPHVQLRELQHDPRYLATAYPRADALAGLRAPLAKWGWEIDGSKALGESLMYAVIRRESAFFPGAISAVGALGLFQIMPLTFENRDDCWLPGTSGEAPTPTPTSYLFDPDRNVQFWSCWVRKEFAPQTRDDIALMLVRHHAGIGNLNEWRAAWRGRPIENDLELQIDTFRFPATQIFVRHVLTDVTIADAAGLFEAGAGGAR